VIPLLAVCVIALFAFVALAIDLGMLMVSRTECQNAADAAALYAARTLDNNVPAGMNPDLYDNQKALAETRARDGVKANIFLNTNFTDPRIQSVVVGMYDYDTTTQQFNPTYPPVKPSGKAWSAVEVIVNGDQPTYFGRVLGINSMPMSARAVAVHRPRDIALVLDFTGSMGYSSTFTYNNVYNSSDTSYPQFGHYQRYLAYQNGNPNASQTDATVGNRPNPLYQTGTVVAAPYVYSPGNFTITTDNGFPIVKDFLYDPNAIGAGAVVTSSTLPNAFHANSFSGVRTVAAGVLTTGPTPAPDNYKNQSDSPSAFAGDKHPRKQGHLPPAPDDGTTSWDVTSGTGAAVNVAEYLGWVANYTSGTSLPTAMLPATPAGRLADWSNFRDATWERWGYDLDVADYVANRGSAWDPRWDWDFGANGGSGGWAHNRSANPPGASSTYRPRMKATPFQGYTMGPAYWGKTFFVWPPDPRPAHDWRRKFFLDRSGDPFATGSEPGANLTSAQVDADTTATGTQSVSGELLTSGTGATLRSASGNYTINYSAVLAWIKSGPQTLPPNLRTGRVRYYTSIPNDVNTSTGTAEEVADKQFWKAYIDYVLTGSGTILAGVENRGWPEGVTPSVWTGELTGYDSDGAGTLGPDPRPYTRYTDNPSRPRMHFWFGPVTMMGFIWSKGAWAGTVHEAQCWQLKAGVSSALDDIRANHPNDLVGMAFFTTSGNAATSYTSVMVPMGQDWPTLKNSLFFPRTLLGSLSNITAEIRPFNASMGYNGETNIPNAQNSTDPNSGLALAFNLLAPSSYVNADPARRGRRGANKIVVFETDGVPNATQRFQFNAYGYESYYTYVGGSDSLGPEGAAYAVVDQIVRPMALVNTSGTNSGMSLPNTPARVYAIGFGDIFSTSAGPDAADFLLEVQKRGKTSQTSDTAIPAHQIITGPYNTRIANLRTALERILQAGVQVTLIE
jgi:hypothetical protein